MHGNLLIIKNITKINNSIDDLKLTKFPMEWNQMTETENRIKTIELEDQSKNPNIQLERVQKRTKKIFA